MAASAELLAFLTEQMAGFGPVSRGRMFKGTGLFHDGRMFAFVAGDVLYLKADAETAPLFDAEHLAAFTYETKTGTATIASYRKAPASCLDDPDEMTRWCRIAWGAAMRAGSPRKTKQQQSRRR
jgi:DNA transformation protein and related proteins